LHIIYGFLLLVGFGKLGCCAAWWEKASIDPTIAARALWLETHPLPTTSDKAGTENPASAVVNITDPRNARRGRRPRKRGPNDETKPIEKVALNDFVQADRGQPAQGS
jgi:hypothetical protein